MSTAIAAVCIAGAFSLVSILGHPEYESFETDSLRDGPEVAAYLVTEASDSDRVIPASMTSPSLDYYLYRCCRRRIGELASPTRTGRLLLVLDEQRPRALDRLKAYWSDVPWQNYGAPTLLQKFGATGIYSVEPRHSDGPRQ